MTNSPNLGLNLQTTGSNNGTWGITLNANQSIIDSRLGARLSKDVSGSSNITVSASEAQNFIMTLTGVLTGNILYILPAQGGEYFIKNTTTGAFTLTVVNSAIGSGVVLAQGNTALLISDPDAVVVYATSATSSIGANSVLANNTTGSAAPVGVALSASNLIGRGSSGNVAPVTLDTSLALNAAVLGIAPIAANSVLANNTGGSAIPAAVTLAATNLLGMGSSGSIAPVTLGTGLAMTGTTLSASGASSGSLVLLSATSPSGASSVSFTSLMDITKYSQYLFVINIVMPSGAELEMLFSTNNGSSYISTGTYGDLAILNGGSVTSGGQGSGATWSRLISNISGGVNYGLLANTIFSQTNGNFPTVSTSACGFAAGGIRGQQFSAGYNTTTTTINAVQILPSSGTITGNIYLYGVKNS